MAASSSKLSVGGESYEIYRLDALQGSHDVARLPYTLRILLENVLRTAGDEDVEAVAGWIAPAEPSLEISFTPSRVLMQDLTGVPAVVDLAAMRDAMADLGGDPRRVNPHIPVELVIDHSVQVDAFASRFAFAENVEREFERNRERYAFLRWGQTGFDNFKVVPPGTGICHQVNLEYLARVVEARDGVAFPDTLVGTDSHTTMVNGLGVLGWGAGGIEAEAAMLGQPVSMLIPRVVGFKLTGELPESPLADAIGLIAAGSEDQATDILRRLRAVRPEPTVFLTLIQALWATGQQHEAFDLAVALHSSHPESAKAALYVAALEDRAGRTLRSREAIARAEQVDPGLTLFADVVRQVGLQPALDQHRATRTPLASAR